MISGNYLDVHAFPVEEVKRLPGVLTDGILQDNPVERLYLFRQRRFVLPLHRDIAHNDNPASLFQLLFQFPRQLSHQLFRSADKNAARSRKTDTSPFAL